MTREPFTAICIHTDWLLVLSLATTGRVTAVQVTFTQISPDITATRQMFVISKVE